jgi:hypothetical protein
MREKTKSTKRPGSTTEKSDEEKCDENDKVLERCSLLLQEGKAQEAVEGLREAWICECRKSNRIRGDEFSRITP